MSEELIGTIIALLIFIGSSIFQLIFKNTDLSVGVGALILVFCMILVAISNDTDS